MEFLVAFALDVPAGTPNSEITDRENAEAAATAKLADEGHLVRVWKSGTQGETTIVGVNRFTDDDPVQSVPAPDYAALEKSQVASVSAVRKKRDARAVPRALQALKESSSAKASDRHLMPLIIDAVRARATVGEIAETLAGSWGYYRPGA